MASREPYDTHRAKKSLGQNFLVDPNLQRMIVEALRPTDEDEVLEIGPGRGALTQHLVSRVGKLILVELDDQLADRLKHDFADDPSVRVIQGDILEVSLEDLTSDPGRLKVIGNIPYNITTPIIFHLLDRRPRPTQVVLMVQREVADRILAAPGGKTFGALAVGVQSVAAVDRVLQVGRNSFRPAPDVDSTVIRISPIDPPPLDAPAETALRVLTRAAFGRRRKQFQRILRDAFHLAPHQVAGVGDATGLDLRARPETFSPQEFIHLARHLHAGGWIQA